VAIPRQSIPDFATDNPIYAGATVAVYLVDVSLNKTGTLATLYANPTGPALLGNPQTLDSRGKWAQPVYVDRPVILTVTRGVDVVDTGIVSALSRWRGEWAAGQTYYAGDRVSIPASISVAVVKQAHVAGVYAADLANGLLEVEIPYEAHTHTAGQISDSTTTGRALVTAPGAGAALEALGVGATGEELFAAATPAEACTIIGALRTAGGIVQGDITVTGAIVPATTFQRNRLINGNFAINQRGVSGTVTLAAGAYGHDRWKAGAGGCTYTFTSSGADTVITITAGSLQQIVEGANIEGGIYTLSHAGTAQARVAVNGGAPSGGYAAAPLQTASATGGQTVTVEITTGTVSRVQLEAGSAATPFERRQFGQELALCQRYFQVFNGLFVSSAPAVYPYTFSVTKRAAPTVASTAAGFSLAGVTPTIDHFWATQTTGSAITVTASAEL
jgi:hypothetical protein